MPELNANDEHPGVRLASAEFTEVSEIQMESRPQKDVPENAMIKMLYSSNQEDQ